jgi:hypothetical protein
MFPFFPGKGVRFAAMLRLRPGRKAREKKSKTPENVAARHNFKTRFSSPLAVLKGTDTSACQIWQNLASKSLKAQ